MRSLPILCAVVTLGGCAVTPPPQTQLAVAKVDYGFETAYSLAAQTYIAAEPILNKPQNAALKANAKALLGKMLTCTNAADPTTCTGYVVLARKAAAASNAADLATEVAEITSLAGQVTQMVAGAK